MSSPPKEEQPEQPQEPAPPGNTESDGPRPVTPAKRPAADDEIEFISSNPVKKRRLTEQKPEKPILMAPPPPTPKPTTPPPVPAAQMADRCRSACGDGMKIAGSEALLENRGTSAPALDSFSFPLSFPPASTIPPRHSEPISPRQLPQVLPSSSGGEITRDQPIGSGPSASSHPTVTLDQISCLDFNGVPTNTPGFDVSRVFSAEARAAAAPGGPPPPSSDLFRDIAETIHATFPSAQVAARHGVAPARVAELISGLVIRPLLLRCAGRPPPATG
ncbi:b616ab4d-4f9b-4f8a-85a2-c539de14c3a2 [Thermothielavioides terrestris]|uniref:B616ab4d-4f9b-4f8a-85a2-c539de14c3a2 n=1 Tax=Thermothielavioides terrestris TaxID=2587410 RepID=A0A3S5CXK1_9PEZI|nr:b616ab4d-4f9b-4f8a-85a2-c539de14c3a2 [Thermothielavioides terrestris]